MKIFLHPQGVLKAENSNQSTKMIKIVIDNKHFADFFLVKACADEFLNE